MKQIIFVFGSNRAGIHGGGAAKTARELYGAEWRVGEGLTGSSYALPTKDENIVTLPLSEIKRHVDKFLDFARNNPDMNFLVTQVGCGLAGYYPAEIAPMFLTAPNNCFLPMPFVEALRYANYEVQL